VEVPMATKSDAALAFAEAVRADWSYIRRALEHSSSKMAHDALARLERAAAAYEARRSPPKASR
jgi:hypothetical protein